MASLSRVIKESVDRARREAGDLIVNFTVKQKSGTTYYNGRSVVDYVSKPVTGVRDKFQSHEIDGEMTKLDDNRIHLFIDSVDQIPNGDSLVVDNGVEYQVRDYVPVYAGNLVVLVTVHLRK